MKGIKRLQSILLKAALLLGVQVNFNVKFEKLVEPTQDSPLKGWAVYLTPVDHVACRQEYHCVIGADGRRNTLPGFYRLEMRGRLAIGITANFVNNHTALEAQIEEKSGVAYIYAQKFFHDLHDETGIQLENIVYYKDDTHYFVMTAKRESLIEKGVIKQVRHVLQI